jgi:hypothetical protein
MKPKGENGVVDNHLNVYGTQGLKVAGTILEYGAESLRFIYHSIDSGCEYLQHSIAYWRESRTNYFRGTRNLRTNLTQKKIAFKGR